MKNCSMTLLELLTIFAIYKDDDFLLFLEDFPCSFTPDEFLLELQEAYDAIKKNKQTISDLIDTQIMILNEEDEQRNLIQSNEHKDDDDFNSDHSMPTPNFDR